MRRAVLLFLDLCLICFATVFSLALRENFVVSSTRFIETLPYLTASLFSAFVILLGFDLNRTIWRYAGRPDYLRISVASAAFVISAVSLTFAFNRLEGVARSLPILQVLTCQAFLIGARIIHKMSHDARQNKKASAAFLQLVDRAPEATVLIVGISKLTEAYLQAIADIVPGRIRVAGLVGQSNRYVGRLVANHPVLGVPQDIDAILDGLEVHGMTIDRIVVALPFGALSLLEREALLRVERARSVGLQFVSEGLGFDDAGRSSGVKTHPRPSRELRSQAALSFEITPAELDRIASRRYWKIKRAFDGLAALILLLICSPFMPIAAVLVRASVGAPVLFWQQRPGLGGHPFRLYKFRTMRAAHAADGRRLSDQERVSRMGSAMRRFRIDELPQLFNILRGDMGFIGPRPLLAREQSEAYRARLLVRPGLTGWAQVVGGRDISPEDKAALDVWYVRHASLRLDLEIVARTIPMLFFGERISRSLIEQAWVDLSKGGILKGDLVYKVGKSLSMTSSAA